ncbi:hypothetical protein D3C87_1616730 [compost metagenome]
MAIIALAEVSIRSSTSHIATKSTSSLFNKRLKWFCPRKPTPIMATLTLPATEAANKELFGKMVAAAAVMPLFLTNSLLFIVV